MPNAVVPAGTVVVLHQTNTALWLLVNSRVIDQEM